MKIKKFSAPTLKEATASMKKELGNDAFILSTRVINKKTDFGIQKYFEITSGVEEELDMVLEEVIPQNKKAAPSLTDELRDLQKRVIGNVNKSNFKIDENIVIAPKPKGRIQVTSDQIKEYVDKLIYQEVSKPIIKLIVNQIKKSLEFINSSNIEDYVITALSSLIPTTNFEIKKKR